MHGINFTTNSPEQQAMRGRNTEKKKEESNGAEKEQRKRDDGKVSLFELFKFADGIDVALMVVGTIAALANGSSQPLVSSFFGQVVDAFGGATLDNVLYRVNKAVLNYVYLAIGIGIAATLQVACWTMSGERQATRARVMYLEAILRQDIAYFDKDVTTGEVIARISSDTALIQDAIGEKVGKFLQLASTFIGGFVVAFMKGWLLSLIMLSAIPPVIISGAAVSSVISKVSNQGETTYGKADSVVEQTFGNIKTVASFNGENRAIALYDKHIRKASVATTKEGAINGFGMGSALLTYFCCFGLAIWYGGQLIVHKGYNGGTIMNVLFALITGAMSLGNATPCVTAFAKGQAAAYRMFETIRRKPDIDAYDESGVVLEDMKGDVELREVYFSYPARPEQLIFSGFSLRVNNGTTMAIVGESGSGKSTVISMVQRFYDPQAGEVLIDGINIKTLNLGWIRERIGLVSQEPLLFMTTIKENILYGKEGATLEEVRRAVEMANAANFIDRLPDGLDTMVGQRGAQLSGGQKQRITIARAILKNPKILLLDEATSALDVESERIVQEALYRIMVERTNFVVAHRLSTIRNADCISVVHQGKIVEQGAHDELIKDSDGAYSQLIRLQEARHEDKYDHHASTSKSPDHRMPIKHFLSDGLSSGSSKQQAILAFGPQGLTPDDEDANEEKGDGKENALKKAPIGRLVKLNKPEFPLLMLGSLAAAVHGVLFPMLGVIISSAIQAFYEPAHKLMKDTRFCALICVILGITSVISIPVQYFLFGVAGGKLVERIQSLSFRSVVRQEVSWFDDSGNSSAKIGVRLSIDALNVRRLVGDTLALMVQCLATLVCGFLLAMVANWELALIITAVIPLVGLQGYAQVKFLKGFSADAKVMYEEANQIASDAVSSIRTVASFCVEKRIMQTYIHKCEASMNQGVRAGWVCGLGFGFSFLMLYLACALCFYVGGKFVDQGKATFTEVFKVFFALVLTTIGISQASALGSDSAKARNSAISIFEIVDRKSKIDPSCEGQVLDNLKGEIELCHISFSYPTRPDISIFTNFSLSIPSGKTVALVGESGSGKSTIIALLERFYDLDSGTILLDGIEITRLNVSWLRKQMGLVNQEPVLFDDTIRANISYGKEGEVTEEELIAVAKASNAHQFISSLPQGYDTYVGERGIQLSGGQKQRVAIARAILKDPKILLLDEATSALDAESEHVVQEALDRVMVGRTSVVVAHRLSTIKGADIIAVLKNGQVVEKGTHDTLMGTQNSVYASLVELRSN
ncbi:ABC transporter B family member 11 [Rhynchospora pubera]|uniref:ABC transporter B family member 11 n=1 Tax=Rhynchospora pubera TaxID=906938 RepID=A0AAV8C555_9POAL|nr:ABC transporter B family member 11 [Rhynchospora pubera]